MKKLHLVCLLFLVVVAYSCTSSKKLYESGNYDTAIAQSIDRLAGKKKKKAKEVEALEIAFEKATNQDMSDINRLKAENKGENWERIYSIANGIERRQKSIEPLLPLIDENGKKASFQFVKTFAIKQEAQNNVANYLYTVGKDLLTTARRGNKKAAREAYANLNKIKQYFENYKDCNQLMAEAQQLGLAHVLFKMENHAPTILPRNFEDEILRIELKNLDEKWYVFHANAKDVKQFDYEVVMRFENIDVSPERITEKIFTEEKQIEDGEEVVRDKDGNALKDSTGNLIKIPTKKIISVEVTEIYQSKVAVLGGTLFFYETSNNRLMDKQSIVAEAIFENYASTFRGDKRALSSETSRRIGNRPLPFPSDEVLLLDAANVVKPIIREKLANTVWN